MKFSEICPNYDSENCECAQGPCRDCYLFYNFHPESELKKELSIVTLERTLIENEREKS